MNLVDKQYIDLIKDILENGVEHKDRTGVGTVRVFGRQMRFNLQQGFPAITCKKIGFRNTVAELLWFTQSKYKDCKLSDLEKLYPPAVKWWKDFVREDGTIGRMYSRQLTNYNGQNLNQIERLIQRIKTEPDSRRLILTTFNPIEAEPEFSSLYPCHGLLTQFMVDGNKLNCSTIQRSVDVALGFPHNIASYALLTHLIAQCCGLEVGELVYFTNDTHLYLNSVSPLMYMLSNLNCYELPKLEINKRIVEYEDFTMEDIKLKNYKSGPAIYIPLAV